MDRLADIHMRYWPEYHKSAEFAPSHRWVIHLLEKEMRKISPGISLPYYVRIKLIIELNYQLKNTQAAQVDAAHPEKSIVWQMLGTTGIHNTGYCLTDGLYAGLNTNRCIRRQWSENGTVPAIDGLEHLSTLLQLPKTTWEQIFLFGGLHFITHLAFGGYRGDMSLDTAPYE